MNRHIAWILLGTLLFSGPLSAQSQGAEPIQSQQRRVSMDGMILLLTGDLSDQTIIAFLKHRKLDFALTRENVLQLSQAGLNNTIMLYLKDREIASAPSTPQALPIPQALPPQTIANNDSPLLYPASYFGGSTTFPLSWYRHGYSEGYHPNDDPGHDDPGHNDPGHNDPGHNDPGHNDPGHNGYSPHFSYESGSPTSYFHTSYLHTSYPHTKNTQLKQESNIHSSGYKSNGHATSSPSGSSHDVAPIYGIKDSGLLSHKNSPIHIVPAHAVSNGSAHSGNRYNAGGFATHRSGGHHSSVAGHSGGGHSGSGHGNGH